MGTAFIPTKDALLDAWEQNFSTLITANPGLYGLTAADAVAIAAAFTAYDVAYAVIANPATKSHTTITAKNIARNASLAVIRPYAATIRANLGVTDANKLALGLVVRDPTPTPVAAPTSSPVLSIIAATPLQHTLRFVDQNTPAIRAKPSGVTGLELYMVTSATIVTDPASLPFIGIQTKNPVAVNFSSADVGKTAYYAGRWVTRRGLVGPWSAIINFTVANG